MRTLLLYLCLCIPKLSFAQDAEWWFDVEVIIFDRNQHISELKEHFVPDKTLNLPLADNDLLTARREPNVSWLYQSLDSCVKNDLVLTEPLPLIEWQNEKEQTELADFSLAEQWLFFNTDEGFEPNIRSGTSAIKMPNVGCKESGFNYQSKRFPMLKVLPVNHFGTLNDNTHTTALLSKSGLELEELSLRIRSERGLTRLLHIAWRQEVEFGRENAKSMRLYGGNNYGFHFTEHGVLHPNAESAETPIVLDTPTAVFENILDSASSLAPNSLATTSAEQFEQRLGYSLKTDTPINIVEPNIAQPSKDIWQIEGRFKVFLQYVNRVPYLHIDSDIAYRQAVNSTVQGENEQTLISISDHPFRRVISTQLHYFDHPLYGMLVEIRRVKKK